MTDIPPADTPLAAWAEAEKDRLDRFIAWWRTEQAAQPDLYPAAMSDAEWNEQYRGWADYLVTTGPATTV